MNWSFCFYSQSQFPILIFDSIVSFLSVLWQDGFCVFSKQSTGPLLWCSQLVPPFALILDSVSAAGWRSRSAWVAGTLEGSQALELLAALTPLTSSRFVVSSKVHLIQLPFSSGPAADQEGRKHRSSGSSKDHNQVLVSLFSPSPQVWFQVQVTLVWTPNFCCRSEGFLALYNGLSASLVRQLTYSTTRFAIYEVRFRKEETNFECDLMKLHSQVAKQSVSPNGEPIPFTRLDIWHRFPLCFLLRFPLIIPSFHPSPFRST